MVSIITVNYNGWLDTCELITSLKQHETHPYEVIVVDNASSGDDVAQISARHPEVMLIRSERNLGFAGGNNLGYRHAKGDYLFFLNNDTVVKAPMLRPLVERLEGDPQLAGVSPAIYYYHQPGLLQYYGYQDMTPITLRHATPPLDPSRMDEYLQPKTTEVLHGAAMMFRREAIKRVGEMYEGYFLFYEEFDWSHRMRVAGYKLFYEPESRIYHKEGTSIPAQTPQRTYFLHRSRMMYARRNCKGVRKLLACAYLLLIALPKQGLSCLLRRQPQLLGAAWRGTLAGLHPVDNCKI